MLLHKNWTACNPISEMETKTESLNIDAETSIPPNVRVRAKDIWTHEPQVQGQNKGIDSI